MAQGQSELGISLALRVNERTAQAHIAHIMVTLGVLPSPSETGGC